LEVRGLPVEGTFLLCAGRGHFYFALTEVVCLYHNTPLSPQGLAKAADIMVGISQQDIQTLKGDVETFYNECNGAGIGATPDLFAHSLGVPVSVDIFSSRDSSTAIQIGERFNFGGPSQPSGMHNYVAITDIVPWINPLNLIYALITGFRDVTIINSLGQLPLEAHSFLGPAYQKALRDSINNRGLCNE
jgi:hypothetical protein